LYRPTGTRCKRSCVRPARNRVYLGHREMTPRKSLARAARGKARSCDMIITSAGNLRWRTRSHAPCASGNGGRDKVLARCGCGRARPIGFGLLDGKPWIGLPGNPRVDDGDVSNSLRGPRIQKDARTDENCSGGRCPWCSTRPSRRTPISHIFCARLSPCAAAINTARLVTGPQSFGNPDIDVERETRC